MDWDESPRITQTRWHHFRCARALAEQVKPVDGEIRSLQFGKPSFPASLRLLLGERTHEVHEVPPHFFLCSIAFTRHFSLAVADDPEELSVRHFFEGGSVTPVAQLKFHVRGEIAFAVAGFSMTHRAVVAKELAHFRQPFRRRRDWILLRGVFGRHLGFRGTRLFLRCIRLRGRQPKTYEQNRTHNGECPAHSFLLTVWAGRRR